MKKSLSRKIICTASILFLLTCAACGSSDSSGGGGGGSDTAGKGDSALLSTNDYPNVGVCDMGSTDVTEAGFLTALGNMTQFTFIHFPYSSDADLPFICGREGIWDPGNAEAFSKANSNIPATTPITQVLQGFLGNVLICNSGFAFSDPSSGGFHDANTYRGELTWTDAGTTYRLRVRFTVSGDNAGKTLASLGITPSDLKFQDSAGNELATIGDVLQLFVKNAGSVTVKVVSGTTTHITALGRVICWDTE